MLGIEPAVDRIPSIPIVLAMRVLMYLLPAGVLLFAQSVSAQMQPHRAEYILRLGSAINAPRVGTATQDRHARLRRLASEARREGEVPISATWKFDVASTLVSDESRSGDDLHYRSRQVQNGTEREVKGTVQRAGGELRAESQSPDGSAHLLLPTVTRMPVASIGYVSTSCARASASFSMLSFDAQGSGEAFRVMSRRFSIARFGGARHRRSRSTCRASHGRSR